MYLQKCVEYIKKKKKKKKGKGLTKLIRSFGNVTDQTGGLGFCFELSVLH